MGRIDAMYARVRGIEPTANMRAELHGLSWSAVGGIVGSGLLFLTSVTAGRLLGPTGYGAAAFVLLVAQLFTLIGAGGLDIAAWRNAASAASDHERRTVIATSLVLVVPAVVGMAGLGLAAAIVASGNRGELGEAGVVLGAMLTLRVFADRLSAAMRWFRFQALARSLEGLVAFTTLLVLVGLGFAGHVPLIAALAAGAVTAATPLLARLVRTAAHGSRSSDAARRLVRFGGIAIVHAITPIGFVYADKFVIGVELGDASLGLYTAYVTGSYLAVAQVLAIVTNVLYTTMAERPDKRPAFDRLRALRRIAIMPILITMFGVVSLVLVAFGREFQYDVRLAMLAAAWSTLLFFNGLLTVIPITHSERSYLMTAVMQGVRSVVFVAYLAALVWIDALSLVAVFVGLVLLEVLDTLNLEYVIRRHVIPRTAGMIGVPTNHATGRREKWHQTKLILTERPRGGTMTPPR